MSTKEYELESIIALTAAIAISEFTKVLESRGIMLTNIQDNTGNEVFDETIAQVMEIVPNILFEDTHES